MSEQRGRREKERREREHPEKRGDPGPTARLMVAALHLDDLEDGIGRARITVDTEGAVRDYEGLARISDHGWLELEPDPCWEPVPGQPGREEVGFVSFPPHVVRRVEWMLDPLIEDGPGTLPRLQVAATRGAAAAAAPPDATEGD